MTLKIMALTNNKRQQGTKGRPCHYVVTEAKGSLEHTFDINSKTKDTSNDTETSLIELSKRVVHRQHHATSTAATNAVLSTLYDTFLPEGHPLSVTPDYLDYQWWDTLQCLCSSITGTLSTRSILRGVGVGSSEATLMSGTLSWVLRDGISMVSRITFASMVATDLDSDAKRWRYVADITNDIALMIEIFSSYLPPTLFLVSVCIASVFKAITAVAGGSARASLTQHFALQQNTADLSAKEGSQETAAGLVGMLLGMLTAWLVPDASFVGTLVVFVVFTTMHLYFNYRAVTSLTLTYMNKQRAAIVMTSFVDEMVRCGREETFTSSSSSSSSSSSPSVIMLARKCRLPSPVDVRRMEGVLVPHDRMMRRIPSIVLGASLLEVVRIIGSDANSDVVVSSVVEAVRDTLGEGEQSFSLLRVRDKYFVIFPTSIPSGRCVLKAFFHAVVDYNMRHVLEGGHAFIESQPTVAVLNGNASSSHPSSSSAWLMDIEKMFVAFEACATSIGWSVERAQLRLASWATHVKEM